MTTPRQNHNRIYYGNSINSKANSINSKIIEDTINNVINTISYVADRCEDRPCNACGDSGNKFAFTYTAGNVVISGILHGQANGNIINVNSVGPFVFNVDGVETEEIGPPSWTVELGQASTFVDVATGYSGPVVSFDGSVMDLFTFGTTLTSPDDINGTYSDMLLFGPATQSDYDNGVVSMTFWPVYPTVPDLNGASLPFNPSEWSICYVE